MLTDIKRKSILTIIAILMSNHVAAQSPVTIHGVPTPVSGQDCGAAAFDALSDLVSNALISCEIIRYTDSGTGYGYCELPDGSDLGLTMIFSGWSVAKWFDRHDNKSPDDCSMEYCEPIPDSYFEAEQQATIDKRGMWSSSFDLPWDSEPVED